MCVIRTLVQAATEGDGLGLSSDIERFRHGIRALANLERARRDRGGQVTDPWQQALCVCF